MNSSHTVPKTLDKHGHFRLAARHSARAGIDQSRNPGDPAEGRSALFALKSAVFPLAEAASKGIPRSGLAVPVAVKRSSTVLKMSVEAACQRPSFGPGRISGPVLTSTRCAAFAFEASP